MHMCWTGPSWGLVPAYWRAACTDTHHHNLPAWPIKRLPPVLTLDLEPEAEGNSSGIH